MRPQVALALAAILAALIAPTARAADRPNVIMIMADDIGYECYSCYGSKQYSTPNIDRLAANGIRFTHAYSQPLCTPSRVKIMTGLSNVRNYAGFSILRRDQKTFGHYMKEAGYRTAVVGKWQLLAAEHYAEEFRGKGTIPEKAGFDNYCLWQIDRRGLRYWKPLLDTDGDLKQYGEKEYGPDIVTDYIMNYLEENRDGPFFLYYPMILVHSPFPPTPDSKDPNSKNRQRNFEDMVAYMDKIIGRIDAKLRELGIAENTLMLITGDNGTHTSLTSTLNGRTIKGGKGKTTDAGTRVALVGSWPGTIKGGRVSDQIVDFTDFLPTFLEAAGAPLPQRHDGRSLLAHLKGAPGTGREWLYTYYNSRPEKTVPKRYVRDTRWKLYGDGRFYDVANDVLEEKPLLHTEDTAEQAAARERLGKALYSMPSKNRVLLKFPE
jgi:arylsulfatase A